MKKKVLFLYIFLVIIVSLGASPFRGIRYQQTPINWDIVTNQYLQGRGNLTSQEPSITVPIEINLPLYSVIQVSIQLHNDETLWRLPLKHHYLGLIPQSDRVGVLDSNRQKNTDISFFDRKIILPFIRLTKPRILIQETKSL